MAALADPAVLDALAARISAHAAVARADAMRVRAAATGTQWAGRAGAAYREDADSLVVALHGAAQLVDDAAVALHDHAARVQQVIAEARSAADPDTLTGPAAVAHALLTRPASVLGGAGAGGPQASAMHLGTGMRQGVQGVN